MKKLLVLAFRSFDSLLSDTSALSSLGFGIKVEHHHKTIRQPRFIEISETDGVIGTLSIRVYEAPLNDEDHLGPRRELRFGNYRSIDLRETAFEQLREDIEHNPSAWGARQLEALSWLACEGFIRPDQVDELIILQQISLAEREERSASWEETKLPPPEDSEIEGSEIEDFVPPIDPELLRAFGAEVV